MLLAMDISKFKNDHCNDQTALGTINSRINELVPMDRRKERDDEARQASFTKPLLEPNGAFELKLECGLIVVSRKN